MSVSINYPTPSPPPVERSFPAGGDYDLTNYRPIKGEVRVYSWVTYQGNEKSREYYTVLDPIMLPEGPWEVQHTVDNDYRDCTVSARIWIDGTFVGDSVSVEHVDIETA